LSYSQTGNAGVHAVTSANGQSYSYDKYGNLVQRGSETLDYDVFNKPTRIGSTYFSYGPDHARFKQVTGNRTTYYVNGGLYEEIVDNGVTTKKSYAGGYLLRSTVGTTTTLTYLHQDHLGSIDAMTDANGNLIDRMSFDPWGKRQQADWNTGNPTGGNPNHYPTTRGYTGHEMLDQSNLIHMNGRVYDPVIGRFLSADLLIQAPFDTQSFNRYSYVWNNPLSLVDPSGYQTCYTGVQEGGDGRGGSISGMVSCNTAQFTGIDMVYFMNSLTFMNNGGQPGTYTMPRPNAGAEYANPGATSSMLGDSSGYTLISPLGGHPVAEPIAVVGLLFDYLSSGGGKAVKTADSIVDGVKELAKAEKKAEKALGTSEDVGRAGKQTRLRELANDDKLGSADRGWIKQEMNSIERGQRSSIRNPPGKDLAHERGREAAKGYDYSHSNLQDRDLHRLQHKYDDFGRANKERPLD
jgi:RHS repeat-associated protein